MIIKKIGRKGMNQVQFSAGVTLVVVLMGAVLFLLSYTIFQRARSIVLEDFGNQGEEIVRGASRRVEHLFSGVASELQELAQLGEIQVPGKKPRSEIMEVTYNNMKNYISCLRRLDSNGNLIIGYHRDCEPIGRAPSEFGWTYFQAASRKRQAVVSEPFLNDSGQVRVRLAYPIFKGTRGNKEVFDGVVAAGVKIDRVYTLMASPFGEAKRGWMSFVLFDSQGQPIIVPGRREIKTNIIFNGRADCARCHGENGRFFESGAKGKAWEIINDLHGKKVVAIYREIPIFGTKWTIGLYADYNHVVHEAREISKYAGLIALIAVLILTVGLSIVLSLVKARKEAERKEKIIERERELLRKVRESEERYRALFDGVENGVYVSTPEGHFRKVNEAMVKMLGYAGEEDLLRLDIATELYVDPRDRERFIQEMEEKGTVRDFESRLLHKDGSTVVCLESSYGRRDESGRIVEYLGVMVDITHREEVEAELRESRKRLRELFDGAGEAIFVEDLDGNILDVNRKAIELFGYDREEFLGLNAMELIPPEDVQTFRVVREVLQKEGHFRGEARNKLKDNEIIDVAVVAHVIEIGEDRLIQVFIQDITEEKRKEREILEKNSELGILHDISKVVNRSLVLDEILNLSLQKTLEVTEFDVGGVYILDDVNQLLNLKSVIGIPEAVVGKIKAIRVGESLTGEVARDRKAMRVDSLVEDDRSLTAREGMQYHSFIGLPLLYGERLVGVMDLASTRRIPEDAYRMELLKGVSELVGIAIGNARLYQGSQERAVRMQILYEAGKSFMAITDMDRLAEKVVDVASSALGYDACSIFKVGDRGKVTMLRSSRPMRPERSGKRSEGSSKRGVVRWVAAKKETRYLPDVSKDPTYLPGWLDEGSELAIPLMVGDDVLGVIDFEKGEKEGFDEESIRFLSLYANQVAWALYNVGLFEEIQKANEDLNRVSELKSQFVSLVSHELRTPMTAIKGSLDIIHSGATGPLSEKQRTFLAMARRNIDRLSEMINNILDLSRIEAGKIRYDFGEVDIQQPAHNVMMTLSASAEERGITLESRLPDSLPTIYADESKVEQVLTNLIANALKSTPDGGKVAILAGLAAGRDLERIPDPKVRRKKKYVKVSVVDTGPGVPGDKLEAIFDRFEQLKGEKGKRGTGLGLAICRYLVEGHGGTIWAEEGKEAGGVFSFLLPVYGKEPPAKES